MLVYFRLTNTYIRLVLLSLHLTDEKNEAQRGLVYSHYERIVIAITIMC